MRRSSFSKPLLVTLATLFAAATILYTALWMYNSHWQFPVELGFDSQYLGAEHCVLLESVQKGSPAERAGLRAEIESSGSTDTPLRAQSPSAMSGPYPTLVNLSS